MGCAGLTYRSGSDSGGRLLVSRLKTSFESMSDDDVVVDLLGVVVKWGKIVQIYIKNSFKMIWNVYVSLNVLKYGWLDGRFQQKVKTNCTIKWKMNKSMMKGRLDEWIKEWMNEL